jgi:signal transduction histidine kinase
MSQLQEPQPATAQRVGTVFIVDDEMMVTSSLQTMLLLETRHRIHCFNNPLEALEQVLSLKPDVVISDFSMPGLDGIHFLRQVKQRLPEATLILLTGYADKENAIEAINTVGIYRYIEKPWDNEELKISINNGLERSQLIGNLRQSVQDLTEARSALEKTNHHLEALVEARTQDLRATYQKLYSIVNNTADGILTLNGALDITSVNPAAERWFRSADNALKDVDLTVLPLEKLLQLAPGSDNKSKKLLSLFDRSKPKQVSEVFIGDLPLEASIAPLPEDPDTEKSGDAPGFVMVLRDIAERKEIERLRDDFVSTLTHDLRTPLLAAIQTLGFFADGSLGELPARQKELVTMLIQSKREMLGLVNVLLEVYKYESGRQKLILDTVNLAELIDAICQELEALSRHREQTLSFSLTGVISPSGEQNGREHFRVLGDKQELKRVFVNLIGNAINFTPKGGDVQVAIGMETSAVPLLRVCVSDNGRGIPAQDLPLLFQRFSQGTSKQRSSGSGLGLYLSRQIVEAHHGHIWVESEEGQGSRFYVTLPAL